MNDDSGLIQYTLRGMVKTFLDSLKQMGLAELESVGECVNDYIDRSFTLFLVAATAAAPEEACRVRLLDQKWVQMILALVHLLVVGVQKPICCCCPC